MKQIKDIFNAETLNKYNVGSWSVITITYIILFFFLILPIGFIFVKSFYVDGKFTFSFIPLMFQNAIIRTSILNSLNLSVVTTLVTTLLSIPLCIIMLRYEFPFKKLFQGLILVPMIMPPFVGAIGIKKFFASYGSVNLLLLKWGWIATPIDFFGGGGFAGVVIMETLHLYPIMYLNLAAAMANVDPSLEEASENLGASKFKIFRTITLPLMLPGYFAGAIIVFIWAFTDLGTPLMFDFNQVVPVQIYNMVKDINVNPMGYVLAMFVVIMTIFFFWISKVVVGKKRYEMLGRGHIVSRVQDASKLGQFVIYGTLISVVVVALLPHLSILIYSMSSKWFMTIMPEHYTMEYYGKIFTNTMSFTGIKNSLLLSVTSTLFDIILGIMIAYILTRQKIKGLNLLDSLVMLPLALPGVVVAFGYVGIFSGTFLDPRVNPMPLLVIAYAIRRLPYMVRSAFAGFQQTSVALEEASVGFGATKFQTIYKITIPLIMANLIAGALLCFSFAMLEVSDSLILAMQEKYYPITKAIYSLFKYINDGPYLASALGMLGMVILTTAILVASRVLGKKMGELFRTG